MPVIRIQAIRKDGVDISNLLREASMAVAKAFSIEVSQCWSTFSETRPGEYFEGGEFRGVAGSQRHSPLVMISAYQGRSDHEIAKALDGVASVILSAFESEPGDAFVEYHEILPGRVHTGGKVI